MTRRLVNVRMSPAELAALDRLAAELGSSRAEAIRVAAALAVEAGAVPVRGRVARCRRNEAMAAMRATWQEVADAFGVSVTTAHSGAQTHTTHAGDGPMLRVLEGERRAS